MAPRGWVRNSSTLLLMSFQIYCVMLTRCDQDKLLSLADPQFPLLFQWVEEDCDSTYKRVNCCDQESSMRGMLWADWSQLPCCTADSLWPALGLPGSQNSQPNGPWLIYCGFSSMSPRAKVLILERKKATPRKRGPRTLSSPGSGCRASQLIE